MSALAARNPSALKHRLTGLCYSVLLAIITTRAVLDPILGSTQALTGGLGQAGGGQGFGAVINAVVLALGIVTIAGSLQDARSWPAGLIWLPFLILLAYGTSRAPSKFEAIRTAFTIVTYFIVFYCSYLFIDSKARLIAGLRAVVISAIIPFFFPLIEVLVSGMPSGDDEATRIHSTFSHPNIFAFYINSVACCILFIMYCVPDSRRIFSRRLLVILLMIGFADLILAQSRSGLLAAAIIAVSFTLFFERRIFVSVIAVIAGALCVPAIQNRILTSLQSGNDYAGWETKLNSYAWRKLLWQSAINDIGNDWFFGKGLDSLHDYSPRFFILLEGQPVYAHNVYVQLLYELGITGLVSYILIFVCMIALAVASKRRLGPAVVIVVLMIAAHCLVSYSDNMLYYLSYNWYFWFLAGLMMSAVHRGLVGRPFQQGRAVTPQWAGEGAIGG